MNAWLQCTGQLVQMICRLIHTNSHRSTLQQQIKARCVAANTHTQACIHSHRNTSNHNKNKSNHIKHLHHSQACPVVNMCLCVYKSWLMCVLGCQLLSGSVTVGGQECVCRCMWVCVCEREKRNTWVLLCLHRADVCVCVSAHSVLNCVCVCVCVLGPRMLFKLLLYLTGCVLGSHMCVCVFVCVCVCVCWGHTCRWEWNSKSYGVLYFISLFILKTAL